MTSNGFDFFEGARTETKVPQITVRRSGQMVLTSAAVALLGDGVTHVQFGFDAKTNAVALRAATEETKGRYRLREQANGSSLVDGRRFLNHHVLKLEKAQRLSAEALGDGMVGFHLPGAVAASGSESETTGKTTKGADQTAKGKTTRTAKQKAAATA